LAGGFYKKEMSKGGRWIHGLDNLSGRILFQSPLKLTHRPHQ